MIPRYFIDYKNYFPNDFLYLTLATWAHYHPNNPLQILIENDIDKNRLYNFIHRVLPENYYNSVYNFINDDTSKNLLRIPRHFIVLNTFPEKGEISFFYPSSPCDFFKNMNYSELTIPDIPNDALIIEDICDDFFFLPWISGNILSYYWNIFITPFIKNLSPFSAFSFCLYGSKSKYCEGMIKNIEAIQKYFPNFHIFLYMCTDVPVHYRNIFQELGKDRLHLYLINSSPFVIEFYRFFSFDHYQVNAVFSRDADSRIGLRDKICIDTFLCSDNNYEFQVIRDHYFHKSKIMAGTLGWKRNLSDQTKNTSIFIKFQEWKKKQNPSYIPEYGTDEKFLREVIYDENINKIFIQSNIVAFNGEKTHPMPPIGNNVKEFIGNTWESSNSGIIEIPMFSYNSIPLEKHLQWLVNEKQWDIMCRMEMDGFYDWNYLKQFQGGSSGIFGLKNIIEYFFLSQIHSSHPDSCKKARYLLGLFCNTVCMDENTYRNSNLLFAKSAKEEGFKFIATTNPLKEPRDISECIIIYGDYPYYAKNLWTNTESNKPNKIYRNVMFYDENLGVPVHWDYEPCWEPINKIYVLNLEDSRDRWISVLGELAKMGAPLNRVCHYMAKRAPRGDKLQIYAGATKNHCDCVQDFINSQGEYCLILEDDFMFCSDYENNKKNLAHFFSRSYDFDICMISYSKIGTTEEYDDMLYLSRQVCTTSSGYILKKSTAKKVYDVLVDGYNKMLETGDFSTYCCDRYWSKINRDNKFFLLKDKLGYQRIMYSNITGLQNMYLD